MAYSENSDGIRIELYKNKKQMSVVNNFSYYFYFGNRLASPGLCLIQREKIPSVMDKSCYEDKWS